MGTKKPLNLPTKLTTARPRSKSMLRTTISSPPRRNASTSSRSTEVTRKSAAGARRLRPQQSDGDGFQTRRFGTDSMMASGTTGAHPRTDSPPLDGPGTRATGIMVDTSSSTSMVCGGDSKARDGSNTEAESQPSQVSQEVQESADLSTSLRSGDSQPLSDRRDSQDAELVLVREPNTTCGRTTKPADS